MEDLVNYQPEFWAVHIQLRILFPGIYCPPGVSARKIPLTPQDVSFGIRVVEMSRQKSSC